LETKGWVPFPHSISETITKHRFPVVSFEDRLGTFPIIYLIKTITKHRSENDDGSETYNGFSFGYTYPRNGFKR
jgi:hypothetical protein